MWRMLRILSLLVCCCALDGLAADTSQIFLGPKELGNPGKGASSPRKDADSVRGEPPAGLQPTSEPLEDELDNQENIISQVSVLSRNMSQLESFICNYRHTVVHLYIVLFKSFNPSPTFSHFYTLLPKTLMDIYWDFRSYITSKYYKR